MTYYRNRATNAVWELSEIKQIYDTEYELQERYGSWLEYLEHLLSRGLDGIEEIKRYAVSLCGGEDDGEEVFESDNLADAINFARTHTEDAPLGCSIFDRFDDKEVIDW